MNKDSPRNQFRRLLEKEQLSDHQYEQLQAVAQRATARDRMAWRPRLAMAMAACLVLALGLQVSMYSVRDNAATDTVSGTLAGGTPSDHEVAERITREVLTNHIHIKTLDRESDSLQELADHFNQLNFRIQPSVYLADGTLYLVGGRYCTLQGNIATHLVYRAEAGHTVSHYQAAYDPAQFGGGLPDVTNAQQPWLVSDRGYQVEIWQERGLVMAKAQPLQTTY